MQPTFDEQDQAILDRRVRNRRTLKGPLSGDFVIFPDGHLERFSHDWGESLQTSDSEFGASFFLLESGDGDFSGGLNPSIKREHFKLTDKVMEGSFWFFHHDFYTAHNGVYFEIPCVVYECDVLRKP